MEILNLNLHKSKDCQVSKDTLYGKLETIKAGQPLSLENKWMVIISVPCRSYNLGTCMKQLS